MEDMKLNALSLTQRVPMPDTRAVPKTPKVKVPKAITAKVEANTKSTKNQPKSTLFLKEPKSLDEMMQTAPHTFGGTENQEHVLKLFHSYQTSNFDEEQQTWIAPAVNKNSETRTGILMKEPGKVTVEFSAKSRSNMVAAALRSHESTCAPDPNVMRDLRAYTEKVVKKMRG